jgi:hypothetical protein
VRRFQEVELIRDHWLNGQRFTPGTVLNLPATCASNLIEAGVAKARDTQPPTSD